MTAKVRAGEERSDDDIPTRLLNKDSFVRSLRSSHMPPAHPTNNLSPVVLLFVDMSDSSNSLSELNTAQAIELETKRLSKKAKKLSPKQLAKEYEELEQRTEMEELARGRWHMVRNVLNILFAVLAGTVFYAVVEDKTWIDALYMSCITVTSVGYGDKKPTTKEGKIFAIFWILSGTLLVGKAIGGYLEFQKEKKQKEIRHRILAKPLSLKEVEMADIDDSKR